MYHVLCRIDYSVVSTICDLPSIGPSGGSHEFLQRRVPPPLSARSCALCPSGTVFKGDHCLHPHSVAALERGCFPWVFLGTHSRCMHARPIATTMRPLLLAVEECLPFPRPPRVLRSQSAFHVSASGGPGPSCSQKPRSRNLMSQQIIPAHRIACQVAREGAAQNAGAASCGRRGLSAPERQTLNVASRNTKDNRRSVRRIRKRFGRRKSRPGASCETPRSQHRQFSLGSKQEPCTPCGDLPCW